MNAEFQRIARRDKKAFHSDHCKEIGENDRLGKTKDLIKRIRSTKGTFHAKMGMKCSLDSSYNLEEISNLSQFVVFLYFFALVTEEGFLISPCYPLELCIQMGIQLKVGHD